MNDTQEFTTPTRKQYMTGEVTHDEYYLALAREAGISYENSRDLTWFADALKIDQHLNSISLAYWDGKVAMTSFKLRRIFKAHGDIYSIAGAVCLHKAAARHAVQQAGR